MVAISLLLNTACTSFCPSTEGHRHGNLETVEITDHRTVAVNWLGDEIFIAVSDDSVMKQISIWPKISLGKSISRSEAAQIVKEINSEELIRMSLRSIATRYENLGFPVEINKLGPKDFCGNRKLLKDDS
jgi:hypothetical protein